MSCGVLILALLALPAAATAAPVVGDTLACISADPSRHVSVVLGRIDVVEGHSIASVSLHASRPDGQPLRAAHLPIELGALEAACPTPAADPRPLDADFEGGYAIWRKAFDADQGGYFTISIDAVVTILLQQIPHTKPEGAAT